MKRIVVVGPPGSGKTTIAREIAARLGLRHVEMDSLWWEPNWTEAGREVLSERLARVAVDDDWVMDGNYFSSGSREVVWPRADTIVWLDLPRSVTIPRIVRRTVSRAVRRTELWSGNREPLGVLRPNSIILFAWRAHPTYRRYEGLNAEPEFAHLTFIQFRRPRDVRRSLRSL